MKSLTLSERESGGQVGRGAGDVKFTRYKIEVIRVTGTGRWRAIKSVDYSC